MKLEDFSQSPIPKAHSCNDIGSRPANSKETVQ